MQSTKDRLEMTLMFRHKVYGCYSVNFGPLHLIGVCFTKAQRTDTIKTHVLKRLDHVVNMY